MSKTGGGGEIWDLNCLSKSEAILSTPAADAAAAKSAGGSCEGRRE